jgi:hypothetical protein
MWFLVDAAGGDPVAVVQCQGIEDVLPAVGLAGHVLAILTVLRRDEVEHLQGGLFVGEVAAVADGSAEASVQRLDRVGNKYDIA